MPGTTGQKRLTAKGRQRREQVLDCALACFAERGYHETTIEDIVTRAGVARGTFYQYFGDKRSIFDELIDRYTSAIDGSVIRIDPQLGLERCLELMRQNIRTVITISLERRELTKIILADAVGLDAEFDRKLLDFDGVVTELIESALTLGQAMGVVRCDNVHLSSMLILGSVKELLYQVIMRELDVEVSDMVEAFLAFLRQGVLELPDP